MTRQEYETQRDRLAETYDPDELLDHMVAVANVVLTFDKVKRATLHQDGVTPEGDAAHTLMLALCALEWVSQVPMLSPVSWETLITMALVHDLVETYAGDTNTVGGLTDSERAAKQRREAAALARLKVDLAGTATLRWIEIYERQDTETARLVRYLDKIVPKLTHALNGCAAVKAVGMTKGEMIATVTAQGSEWRAQCPRQVSLHRLFDAAAKRATESWDEETT